MFELLTTLAVIYVILDCFLSIFIFLMIITDHSGNCKNTLKSIISDLFGASAPRAGQRSSDHAMRQSQWAAEEAMRQSQQAADEAMRVSEEQSRWAAEEGRKSVTPFEHGGYDMTQGNSFNNDSFDSGFDSFGGFDSFNDFGGGGFGF